MQEHIPKCIGRSRLEAMFMQDKMYIHIYIYIYVYMYVYHTYILKRNLYMYMYWALPPPRVFGDATSYMGFSGFFLQAFWCFVFALISICSFAYSFLICDELWLPFCFQFVHFFVKFCVIFRTPFMDSFYIDFHRFQGHQIFANHSFTTVKQ